MLFTFVTGPLGSFIIWRRMSAFGDTLSHASLLGLAGGALLNINYFYMILFLLLIISILIVFLEHISFVSLDTILGIISHSALSLGMIILSMMSETKRIGISNYFFGNLLKVNISDLIVILLVIFFVLFILIWYWREILCFTINRELAIVDGINVSKMRLILIFITTLVIAISIKFIGSLVVTALLIIPAATAQKFSTSPENMAIFSTFIGMLGFTFGMIMAAFFDFPTSPSVVLFLSFFFLLSHFKKNN
ncbi:metal ABC transporter permease [Buchnera aphidicola (Pemphigus obesinymphae)]|uniref:iron chelate uptake ABC transporter family permease subunit n=1 Tax=Buchnera aphidicola TaxID=9 RepID=UPI002238DF13|nr:iron chelate uptake ABC transporter family permease subunit [Buchnera aphidicola]MCW5196625.1 metal ABC transporter permease [Buchnera aphidicola (Pemphigus obesinymphae)]